MWDLGVGGGWQKMNAPLKILTSVNHHRASLSTAPTAASPGRGGCPSSKCGLRCVSHGGIQGTEPGGCSIGSRGHGIPARCARFPPQSGGERSMQPPPSPAAGTSRRADWPRVWHCAGLSTPSSSSGVCITYCVPSPVLPVWSVVHALSQQVTRIVLGLPQFRQVRHIIRLEVYGLHTLVVGQSVRITAVMSDIP